MEANRFTHIIVFEAAIGDVSGTAVLNVSNGNYGRFVAGASRSAAGFDCRTHDDLGGGCRHRPRRQDRCTENRHRGFRGQSLASLHFLDAASKWHRHIFIELVYSQPGAPTAFKRWVLRAINRFGQTDGWFDEAQPLALTLTPPPPPAPRSGRSRRPARHPAARCASCRSCCAPAARDRCDSAAPPHAAAHRAAARREA